MKKTILILFSLIAISCNSQDKKMKKEETRKTEKKTNNKTNNTMIEKFDFEEYKKRKSAVHTIYKENGIRIKMNYNEKRGGTYNETPSKPYFYTIYKEFYINGNLKLKTKSLGKNVKIGISKYYDEQGNLIKEIDEDKKFGKIKPNDVLKFLETKGYIDLKTGKGRIDDDANHVFTLFFNEKDTKEEWLISITKGQINNFYFPEIGEPITYYPTLYSMDRETGETEELSYEVDSKTGEMIFKDDNKKEEKVYKTHEGKNYTKEEWKKYEEDQFKNYKKKK